jgi:glycosyltransferase involved in cell wall biosynthesis
MDRLVSVIIPVFNAEEHLDRLFSSLQGQLYQNFEVIVIDDGSTDDSGSLCKAYQHKFSKFRYFYQHNSGVSAARNFGIEKISGHYMMFIDADDFIEPQHISDLVRNQSVFDVDLVTCCYKKIYGDKVKFIDSRLPFGKYSAKSLELMFLDDGSLTGMLIGSGWTNLYLSELIHAKQIKFDEDMKSYEDGLFNLDYLSHSRSVYVSGSATYNYVMHDTQSSKNYENFGDRIALLLYKLRKYAYIENYESQIIGLENTAAIWSAIYITSNNNVFNSRLAMKRYFSSIDFSISLRISKSANWKKSFVLLLLKCRLYLICSFLLVLFYN